MRRRSRAEKKSHALPAPAVREEAELSPEVLADMLAALRQSQLDLTRTIDVLAQQIDSLQSRLSRAALPPLPFGSTIPPRPVPSLFDGPTPALVRPLAGFEIQPQSLVAALMAPPPPPPPGFEMGKRTAAIALPPPPPPGFEMGKPTAAIALPPPPPPGFEMRLPSPVIGFAPPPAMPSGAPVLPRVTPLATEGIPSLSPFERLLGAEFGRPPVTPSVLDPSVAPSVPTPSVAPSSSDASPPPSAPPPPSPSAPPPPTPSGDTGPVTEERAAKGPDFAFRPVLDHLADDDPSPTSAPVPDFFRSSSQSFAAAAAMVNDILAAAPDSPPEPGRAAPTESESTDTDEPASPEIPITPDFFTARPRKKFGLRR